jgi:hypothetical protein
LPARRLGGGQRSRLPDVPTLLASPTDGTPGRLLGVDCFVGLEVTTEIVRDGPTRRPVGLALALVQLHVRPTVEHVEGLTDPCRWLGVDTVEIRHQRRRGEPLALGVDTVNRHLLLPIAPLVERPEPLE